MPAGEFPGEPDPFRRPPEVAAWWKQMQRESIIQRYQQGYKLSPGDQKILDGFLPYMKRAD